ncbi:GumC family protein [Acuticoccus sediminis]|uniref:GumC family protein n=1 Tax=Acuticoccus sediminis TaxID=2184697 RepID=UPI001CFD152F|nr:hypothetical protein [Acuticoccus sediminis]
MNSHQKIGSPSLRLEAAFAPEVPDDVVDVFAILRLVRRRIGLIVVIAGLLTVAAVPAILAIKTEYHARARVLLQTPLRDIDPDKPDGIDIGTEVERLWSRPVARRVIDELKLADVPEFNPALRGPSTIDALRQFIASAFASSHGDGGEVAEVDPSERIMQAYYAHLDIRRADTSEVVEIGFGSTDPALAAMAPNALIDAYRDDARERRLERVAAGETVLAGRMDEQKQRIEAARASVRAFETTNAADLRQATDAEQTVASLSAERGALLREKAEVQSRLQAAELGAKGGGLDDGGIDDPNLFALQRELDAKRFQYAEFSAKYGAAHKSTIEAETAMRETEVAIEAELQRQIGVLRSRLTAIADADEALSRALGMARVALVDVRRREAEHLELKQGVEREIETLTSLEASRRTLQSRIDVPTVELEVLSPATIPLDPQGYGRATYAVAWSLVAAAIAFTVALAIEVADRSVRSTRQLSGAARRAAAVLVPGIRRRDAERLMSGRERRTDPALSEAMRMIMLRLEHSAPELQSVVVTSTRTGAGASFIATALAQEYARNGQAVLLAQIGWRSHRDRGTPGWFGFVKVAERPVSVGHVICESAGEGIAVLKWGERMTSLLKDRDAIDWILRQAAAEDRLVIFDCPPVLEAVDALVVAGRADRALLVLKWGATARSDAEAAYERLSEVCLNRILMSVNMVERGRHALYGFPDAGLMARA